MEMQVSLLRVNEHVLMGVSPAAFTVSSVLMLHSLLMAVMWPIDTIEVTQKRHLLGN